MSEHLMSAIEAVRGEVARIVEEIIADPRIERLRKLHASLNSLEDLCEQERTPFGALLRIENETQQDQAGSSFRADEFYGLEPLDAAKRILKKRGRALPLAEIVSSIRRGGGDPGNEHRLRVSLARSTMEIAKVGDDLFGLLEFYPHVKRGNSGRPKKKATDGGETNGEEAQSIEDLLVDDTPVEAELEEPSSSAT